MPMTETVYAAAQLWTVQVVSCSFC